MGSMLPYMPYMDPMGYGYMIYPKLQNLHDFAYYICQLSDAKLWHQKKSSIHAMPCHDNPWSV